MGRFASDSSTATRWLAGTMQFLAQSSVLFVSAKLRARRTVSPSWSTQATGVVLFDKDLTVGRTATNRSSKCQQRIPVRAMHPLKKTARVAGFLYLLVVLAGPFVLIYVPNKLFVPGDATATASNILAHQSLFRAHIAVGIVSEFLFIAVVLVLYRLLKGVSRQLAMLMVILILIDAPLAFLSVANEVAALTFLRGADFLAVFDKPQRDALATLLINFDQQGVLVSEIFWGLWLLPLGLLVYRSGFLPRFLGVWLFINGLAYLVISSTRLLLPQYNNVIFTIATPLLFGEIALMLWLLIVGARVRPSVIAAAS